MNSPIFGLLGAGCKLGSINDTKTVGGGFGTKVARREIALFSDPVIQ